jgi:hypothetical protein
MTPRIPLEEWAALTDELQRFGHTGDVTTDDGEIRLDFGSAYVEVTRDGTVRTGMPLHEFERADAVAVFVDHDAGALTVEDDDTSYTFRRPGR